MSKPSQTIDDSGPRIFRAVLLTAISSVLLSCGGSEDGDHAPASFTVARIVVAPASSNLEVGKTMVFRAQAFDANGAPVESSFTWESSDVARATVDATGVTLGVAPGSVDITAAAGAVRSAPASLAVNAVAPGPTTSSFENIDAALKSGAIDEETAIKYKMFATFKDARLPAEYRGDDSNVTESDAFELVYARWSSFSDATKETLEPFLVPPAYRGSFASPSAGAKASFAKPQGISVPICRQPTVDPNWAAKPAASAGGRVKVWYDTRVADANTQATMLLNEFETKIWPTLVDSVGMRAPLSDGTLAGCNGGDGRLDIYLVDMATHGQVATDLGETFPVHFATKHHPVLFC